MSAPSSSNTLSEQDLAEALMRGQGIIILGPPIDGKSATLYQIVHMLKSYDVVVPYIDRPVPSETDFELMRGRNVVLLIDDLSRYLDAAVDLSEFSQRLARSAKEWVVAATCRTGSELSAVQEEMQSSLRRFYENIPLKVRLIPLTNEEMAYLARSIDRSWALNDADDFPTVGFITMIEPERVMRARFVQLPVLERDVLSAIKILAEGAVVPVSHQRLTAVLEHVYHRPISPEQLIRVLRSLTEQSFLYAPAHQDPVNPVPTVLRDAVAFTEGKESEGNLKSLVEVLSRLRDEPGLRVCFKTS